MIVHKNTGENTLTPVEFIDSITYLTEVPFVMASVITYEATDITQNSATVGGIMDTVPQPIGIVLNGCGNGCFTGICFGTSPNPTLNDQSIALQPVIGAPPLGTPFSTVLENLEMNTTYYVRTYAMLNLVDIPVIYGNEVSFTTSSPFTGGGVTFDGYSYSTIVVGEQEWMAENLRSTHYANGDLIEHVPDAGSWNNNNISYGAWCHYDNDAELENAYGKLYNGYAVMDSRNICPTNWHVPSDSEWTEFIDLLGGELEAGGHLKSTGFDYWCPTGCAGMGGQGPNVGATNSIGWNGRAGGQRGSGGTFQWFGAVGRWWSSADINNAQWLRQLEYSNTEVYRTGGSIASGNSVRCIKD
tara:strand:+ start:657 stop:1727 length:1071 start_codon:yes stop_codon:yes gene_type:complete